MENAFGMATSRSYAFRRVIMTKAETVIDIIIFIQLLLGCITKKTISSLLNLRMLEAIRGLVNLGQVASNNYSKSTKKFRDHCKEYFNSETGAESLQNDIIARIN